MLIDEIIDLLSDENSSLSNALLKTSVLLHRIGKKDLAEWVTYELEGYPSNIEVPEYRKLPARLVGNAANIGWKFDSHPIPIMHLSQAWQDNLSHTVFRDPLNALEELSKGESVSRPLPLEICPMLSKGLTQGTHVSSAWCSTTSTAIKGTLMKIRAKLLSFLLNLKDSLGDNVKESEMKDKVSKIDANTMFRDTIFGSNTTVIIGNSNSPTIHNVIQNDFASLSKRLLELGIQQTDIDVLKVAIDEDISSEGKPSLQGKTGGWFTRILSGIKRGASGSVEAVSSGVTKAILDYIQ